MGVVASPLMSPMFKAAEPGEFGDSCEGVGQEVLEKRERARSQLLSMDWDKATRPTVRTDIKVVPAVAGDAAALNSLHAEDYVEVHELLHRHMFHGDETSTADWDEALGHIDFVDVLRDFKRLGDKSEVRVLKCVDPAENDAIMGYCIFELRKKGKGKKVQRYCELVNVVVGQRHRGRGAGSKLFQAMVADIENVAPAFSKDLRLFVAKENVNPAQWYERLGFKTAGFQPEKITGVDVVFVRMIRQAA